MLKSYPAIFHKEKDNYYWVEFPDSGGGTDGLGIKETMKHAHEMLESALASYIDEELPLQVPTDILILSVEDGFLSLIQVDPTPFIKNTKAIRKNVTVPEWLVRLADRENINYSGTLTKALELKLQA